MNRLRSFLFLAGLSALLTTAFAAEPVALTRADAVAALARDLAAHYRVEGELELELLRPFNDVAAPAAQPASGAPAPAEWTVAVAEYPANLSPSLLLRVRFALGERTVREDTLALRAQLFREVWVASAPLDRGTTFDPAQLDTRRVDVLREREVVPTASGDRNYTYARAVPAGRLLTWRDLGRRALVRKGDVIEVAAVDGPLQITMKALAMENGAAGETVRVRNLDSKKEFAALVVSDARALVRF